MRISRNIRSGCMVVTLVAACVSVGFAGKKQEPKTAKEQTKIVDSGSFGIFVNGQRVATETFKIEQGESGSIVSSEFKTDGGKENARQTAELRMDPNGDLRKYSWREESPGKGQTTVEPAGEFVIERIVPDAPEKPVEVPLLVSISSSVLDDYFFSQREVLIWRYMAQNCGATIHSECSMPKVPFGVLVPRQRTTASASVEYRGKEKVVVKGSETTLDRFNLNVEGDEWAVYLDENFKMLKIVIPAEKTEVVRD